MKNRLETLLVLAMMTFALVGAQASAAAESKANAEGATGQNGKPSAEKEKAKRDWYPFYGTVASINKSANTISLKKKEGERLLKVDAKSKIEVDGKSATLGSVRVGSYAHGKLHKDSAGKEIVTAAKFDKEPPKRKKKPRRRSTRNSFPSGFLALHNFCQDYYDLPVRQIQLRRSKSAPLRRFWKLAPGTTFLNHGSFGACPTPILELQNELRRQMEAEPVQFLWRRYEARLEPSREIVAHFLGARAQDVVFVTNATTAINAVVRSMKLRPGDQLLTTNLDYNACHNAFAEEAAEQERS
jgi:hypothetical protein